MRGEEGSLDTVIPYYRITVANLPRSLVRLKPLLPLAFRDFTVGKPCRALVWILSGICRDELINQKRTRKGVGVIKYKSLRPL